MSIDELLICYGRQYFFDNELKSYLDLLKLASERGMKFGDPIAYLKSLGHAVRFVKPAEGFS